MLDALKETASFGEVLNWDRSAGQRREWSRVADANCYNSSLLVLKQLADDQDI